jgi:hypothetical protein
MNRTTRSRWKNAVLSVAVITTATLVVIGCGGDEQETPETPETPPRTEPEAEPGPVVTDPSFELRATAQGPYAAGTAATFEIALVPRGQFHVNVDPNFPFAIALAGPDAVRFAEASLDREDAAEFAEERARFAVGFTPTSAGSHRVTAVVDFAVCTPTSCLPEQRTLALHLPVE